MVSHTFTVYPRTRGDSRSIWYYRTRSHAKEWSNGRSTGIPVAFAKDGKPTAESRRCAEEWVEHHLHADSLPDPFTAVITFGDFARDFWAPDSEYVIGQREFGRYLTESHRYNRQRQTEAHLIPHWGKWRLDEITSQAVKSWLLERKRNGYWITRKSGKRVHRVLTGTTMNDIRNCFSQILQHAVAEGYLRHNPVKAVPRFRGESKERGVLNIDELRMLLDPGQIGNAWTSEIYWLATFTAAGTGLRMGELRVLQPQNIGDTYIRVMHGWDERAHRLKAPKWDKTRTTPAPAKVTTALRDWIDRNEIRSDGWVFPGRRFRDGDGWRVQPLSDFAIRSEFYRVLEEVGIDQSGRNIVFHSLRHSIVLASRTSGVDPWQMMKAIGHGDLKMLDHYSDHAVEAAQLAAVVEFQRALFDDASFSQERAVKSKNGASNG